MHIFQFPTSAQIVERTDDPTYLIDIAGLLLSIGDVEVVAGGRIKRDFNILCSLAGKVRTTLWGPHAQTFVASHKLDEATAAVMIVVTSLTVRQYSGVYNFSATGGTQTFIDLEHDQVAKLRAKLAAEAAPVKFLGRSPGTVSTKAEAISENRVTISEILEAGLTSEQPGYRMTFTGTITEILTQNGWHYFGCIKCKSKLVLTDESYTCPQKCVTPANSQMVFYKFQFTVQDESDTLICTTMNNVAERMVDSSAQKLFNRSEAGDDSLPKPILSLCGQQFIFKIQLSTYNLQAGNDSFTVVDVFTPEPAARGNDKSVRSGKGPRLFRGDASKGKNIVLEEQTEVNLTPKKRKSVHIGYSDDDDE